MPSDLSAEVPEVSGRRTLSTVPVLLLVGLVGVRSGVFAAFALAVVLFLANTTGEQLKRTAVLVVPLVLASLALVTAPDLIERMLIQL